MGNPADDFGFIWCPTCEKPQEAGGHDCAKDPDRLGSILSGLAYDHMEEKLIPGLFVTPCPPGSCVFCAALGTPRIQ